MRGKATLMDNLFNFALEVCWSCIISHLGHMSFTSPECSPLGFRGNSQIYLKSSQSLSPPPHSLLCGWWTKQKLTLVCGTTEHFLCALLRMQRRELGIHYFRTAEAQGDPELTTAAVTQLLLVFKANASL